jgi:hypothetical protein
MLRSLSAAGFMGCGAAGVAMSEEEGVVDDTSEGHISDEMPMPLEYQIDLAERIADRLNPHSRPEVSEMIHAKAKVVGAIFTGYAVFWWLTVLQVEDNTNFESIFFGPDFITMTIIAPCLIFLGSLLSEYSRVLGQLFPGIASGIMFVLAILYTFEPLIMGLVDNISMNSGMWMSFRLVVLCATVLFAAKLLVDALLLSWVKTLMEAYPDLDFSDPYGDSNHPEDVGSETEA